jgi:hypothetical protein
MKYLIVLFKNKERKRIIKKFKTYERAINFFDSQILKNKEIIFDKAIENGNYCSFEIGLLEKNSNNFDLYFVKDDMGRNLKIDLDDPEYKILNISNYQVEELIFDVSKNKKISFSKFVTTYLTKGSIKLISKLNNKVVVQDDDVVNLFSLKSDEDCYRFLGILENYMFNKKRSDCIIVIDGNIAQKKYLYNLLQSKGISKSILYKQSTTHFKG